MEVKKFRVFNITTAIVIIILLALLWLNYIPASYYNYTIYFVFGIVILRIIIRYIVSYKSKNEENRPSNED